MNSLLPRLMLVVVFAAQGCQCGPSHPTPVTFRLKNTSRDAIFVDHSQQWSGLRVKRKVNGEWLAFVETPACACLACDVVCGGCACDPQQPARVRRIDAAQVVERSWEGTVQISTLESCGSLIGGTPCLRPESPPSDEQFQLELCYSPSAPGFQSLDGGSEAAGLLPSESIQCVQQLFRPMDSVVEIAPIRGAECTTHDDCRGAGELCFGGGCTTSCPANDFPEIGGEWQVRVAEPDDQGFFETVLDGSRRIYTGEGSISSVLYQNNTMTLRVTRQGQGGQALPGAIYVTLPPGHAAPMLPGSQVSIRLIDASSAENYDQRAVVIRDGNGALILAADTAQGEGLLGEADTAPFAVSTVAAIIGCQHNSCGKRIYLPTRFDEGGSSVELLPAQSAVRVAGGGTYRLLAVGNQTVEATACKLTTLHPYAIVREKAP